LLCSWSSSAQNSKRNIELIGVDFDFIFALVFVTVSGAERGWDSCFLQDVILPFFERGILLFKIQFLVSEGQNRGEKPKLPRGLNRSRFREDSSCDFSAQMDAESAPNFPAIRN